LCLPLQTASSIKTESTALRKAVLRNDTQTARSLVEDEQGAHLICQPDYTGYTPISTAFIQNHVPLAEHFIQRLLDIKYTETDILYQCFLYRHGNGKTILHFAATMVDEALADKCITVCAKLLADVPDAVEQILRALDRNGNTAFHLAAAHGNKGNLISLFHAAAKLNDKKLINTLLRQCNWQGNNLLMCATSGLAQGAWRPAPKGCSDVVDWLLAYVSPFSIYDSALLTAKWQSVPVCCVWTAFATSALDEAHRVSFLRSLCNLTGACTGFDLT